MNRIYLNLCYLGILILTSAAWSADQALVRGIIFSAPQCQSCADFEAYLLPPLIERYGKSLEFAQFDITQSPGEKIYQAARKIYPIEQWNSEITILIGKRAIHGLDAIALTIGDHFSDLINDETARNWPKLPELANFLSTGIKDFQAQATKIITSAPEDWRSRFLHDPVANSLAVLVLLIMLVVLIHNLIRLRQGASNPDLANFILPFILSAGMGISAYTAYAAIEDIKPMCGPIGDCVKVQASVYSRFFGIPLGIFGILAYGTLLISDPIARRLSPNGGGWRWLPWSIALFGFLFSLRLTTLEPFFIGATCLWCLGSALAMTAAFWIFTGLIPGGRV